ncbi:hypothetical protein AK88_00478 [Plasmodium fragile]|uniref:NTF2 domain-containing protein n=1 Tax=Plasmodium fragile TaxID=5857 RepID=A0A0D9QRP7_PLAFR|nr:uncharacterized protein AK88_00478 [Plasmodium fragile]KJP89770.1 hypothetical protein AK88_00478 [Plasmodium fragile]
MNSRSMDAKQHNKSKNKFSFFFFKNKYSSAKQCLGQGSGSVNPQGGVQQNTNQGPQQVSDNVCSVFEGSTTNNPSSLNNNSNMYYKRRSNFSGAGMVPANSVSGTDAKNTSTMMSYNEDIYNYEKPKLLNGSTTGTTTTMNAYHVDASHGNSTSGSINNGAGNQANAHQGKFYNNKNTYNVHAKKEGRQNNYDSYLSCMHDGTSNNTHGEGTTQSSNRTYKNYNYEGTRENYINIGGPKNVNRYYDVADATSCMTMSGQKKVNYFDSNVGGYQHDATHAATTHSASRDAGGQDPYGANEQLRREPQRGKNAPQDPSLLGSQKKEPMLIMINGDRNNNNNEDVNNMNMKMKMVKKEDHVQAEEEYEEEEDEEEEEEEGDDDDDEEDDEVDEEEEEAEEEAEDLSLRKNSHNVGTTRGSSNHVDAYANAKEVVTFTNSDARKGVNTPMDGSTMGNASANVNVNAAAARASNPHDRNTNVETMNRPHVSTPSNHLTGINNKSMDPMTGSAYNIACMFIYQYYYVLHTKKAMMHNFYAQNAVLLLSFNYQTRVDGGAAGSTASSIGGGPGGGLHPTSNENQQSDMDKFFNLSQIHVEGSERSGNMLKIKGKQMIADYYNKLGISECTVHINSIEVINVHEEIYLYIHGRIKKNKNTNLFYYFVQNIHLHKHTVCQYYVDVDFIHYYYLDIVNQHVEDTPELKERDKAITGGEGHVFDMKGKEDGTKKKYKVSKLNATLGGKTGILKGGEAVVACTSGAATTKSSSRLKQDPCNKTINGLKKGAVKKADVEPVLASTQGNVTKESKVKTSNLKGQMGEGNYPPGHATYNTATKQSVLTFPSINKNTEGKNNLAKYAQRVSSPGDGFHGEEREYEEEEEEEGDYLDVGDEEDIEEDDEEDAELDMEDDEEEDDDEEEEEEGEAFEDDLEQVYEEDKKEEGALFKKAQGVVGKSVKKGMAQQDGECYVTNATLKKNKLKNEDEGGDTRNSNVNGAGKTAGDGGSEAQERNDGSGRKQQMGVASPDGGKKERTKEKAAATPAGMNTEKSSIGKEGEEEKDHVASKPTATTDMKKNKKNKSDGTNNVWKVDSEEKCPKMETILKEEKILNENGKKKKKEKEKSSKVDPNSWVFRVMKSNTGTNSGENQTPATASHKVQEGMKHDEGIKHVEEEKHTEEGETDVETQEEETEEHEINANDKKIIIHNIHKNMDKKKINDCIIDRLKNYNDGHAVQIDIYQRSAKKVFPSSFNSVSYEKGKTPESYSYAIAELDCRQSQKLLLDLGLYCNGIKLSIENFKEKRKTPEAAKRNSRKFSGFGGAAPVDQSKGKEDRYRNSFFRGSSATVTTVGVAQFRSKRNNIFVK